MKKIAILTSGILPVPAVQGGAVENLIDFYLEYNEQHKLHDITVYSVWHPNVKKHPALQSTVNHYYYIDTSSYFAKLKRKLYKMFHADEYYNYFIEYFFEQAYTHIAKERYDYIVLENRPGYALKLLHSNSHIVLHLHNDLLNNITPQNCAIFRSLTGILTVSNYIKTRVSTIVSSGCESSKIITVHNGIDIGRFVNAQPIPRAKLGIKEEDFMVVFSGRIIPEKGILELIKAVKAINDITNLKLLIIGASFYGIDNRVSDYMQILIDEVKPISDKVIFTGYVDYDDMPIYLKAANVSVIPSLWDEPFGLTVLEAMAAGLPLITTKGGAIPEICEDTAILIERNDIVQNIIEAIRYIYYNPDAAKSLSKKAQERSWSFDKNIFSKTYLKAIDTIINHQSLLRHKYNLSR